MTPASTIPTKSTIVPFNFLESTYPVLRNFLEVMPLKELYYLRQKNENVNSLSRFRGEIVDVLCIITDTVEPWNCQYISHSEFMNRPTPTKPFAYLDVVMGSDISPKALLAKIGEQQYFGLYISGEYHWQDVVSFLHPGVSVLCLYEIMELPKEDMKKFFKILIDYKIERIQFCNNTCEESWFYAAHKTWNSLIGTGLKRVEVREWFNMELTATTTDDATTKLSMNLLVDADFDGEDEYFSGDELDDDEYDGHN
uniref:F-box domain-containing protein n=1 Tax=Panagrellus redivivus TaxID=6233 RepID=A0A7E4V0F6_PANRE